MADNVTLPGTGSVVASDDIGSGVQVQRVKPVWGADGTGNDTQVSNPLPAQATLESSQMSAAGTIVTPQYAVINVSSNGDNAIVAAAAGKVTRVLAYVIVADSAVAAKWNNGTTALSGAMSLSSTGGVSADYCPVGHFQTSTNTALNLNLASAIGVRGHLTYIQF